VLFASAAVRREGALTGRVAVPFAVRASTVGFTGDADGETVYAEIWMPEWGVPITVGAITDLFATRPPACL
jgi:CRISPR-associated protein Csx17